MGLGCVLWFGASVSQAMGESDKIATSSLAIDTTPRG
jgi:hypothetical protein